MPARVYSERFLHGRATGATQTLVVPADKRAVVRFLALQCFDGTAPCYIGFWVASVPVFFVSNPPDGFDVQQDLRVVAYAGESISIITDSVDVAWHASGFLFADV